MPFEIRLSQLEDRVVFEKAVADHVDRLTAFNKEIGKPRPVAHPLIESSIQRQVRTGQADRWYPDYVIVDDSPPPPPVPTLDDKKHLAHLKLVEAENAAKYKILPQRKMRLAEAKAMIAYKVKEEDRTPEQSEDIAAYELVRKLWEGIGLIGAQAESDIDDLTEETADSWQPPNFG